MQDPPAAGAGRERALLSQPSRFTNISGNLTVTIQVQYSQFQVGVGSPGLGFLGEVLCLQILKTVLLFKVSYCHKMIITLLFAQLGSDHCLWSLSPCQGSQELW